MHSHTPFFPLGHVVPRVRKQKQKQTLLSEVEFPCLGEQVFPCKGGKWKVYWDSCVKTGYMNE